MLAAMAWVYLVIGFVSGVYTYWTFSQAKKSSDPVDTEMLRDMDEKLGDSGEVFVVLVAVLAWPVPLVAILNDFFRKEI